MQVSEVLHMWGVEAQQNPALDMLEINYGGGYGPDGYRLDYMLTFALFCNRAYIDKLPRFDSGRVH